MISLSDVLLFAIFVMVGVGRWADMRKPPRTSYTTLDAAIDAVSRVVAGLHEDLDAVRKELRSAVSLPPETQVPRLLRELRQNRRWTYLLIALHIALGLAVLALYLELRRRGLLAHL